MADETPLADEPKGNQKIILIFAAAGVLVLIIFLLIFSGIFKQNVSDRGNSNATTNLNRANP